MSFPSEEISYAQTTFAFRVTLHECAAAKSIVIFHYIVPAISEQSYHPITSHPRTVNFFILSSRHVIICNWRFARKIRRGRDTDSPTRDGIDIRSSRALPRRQAKTSGKLRIHRPRRGEILPTFSGVTSQQSSFGAGWSGKSTRGKLARFATDRHASRNPTCFLSASVLASILPRTIFRSSPPSPSFYHFSAVTIRLLTHVPFLQRSWRSFSRPLQTIWILENGDTDGLSKFHLDTGYLTDILRLLII